MKAFFATLALALLACLTIFGEDRERSQTLEKEVRKWLESKDREDFYKAFYFTPDPEFSKMMREYISEVFARDYKSGIGEIQVWPFTDSEYHKEVMGLVKSDGLYRPPGPPFAYLEIYAANPTDEEEAGHNFRLAMIEGKPRIVFHQLVPDTPQFLDGRITTWRQSDGEEFEARLVRVISGVAHFRTRGAEPLLVKTKELSNPDQERIAELTARGEQGGAQ